MNNPNYEKLIRKLNELFMLDQAELDFGIYRVMNFRRKEIKAFIENDLLKQVKMELDKSGGVDRKATQKKLDVAIKQALDLGIDAEMSPKVKELRKELAQSGNAEAMENEVFSHLFAFFNRYYESGDFIALRRYKEGVYAIPYEGEEVKLHWANADQYYIKSSEYFKNYRFTLSDGKTVDFTLRAASTEQNNNKSIGNTERRFKLVEIDPLSCSVPRNDNEVASLQIFFNYEPVEKSVKQDDLTKSALERLETMIPKDFYELLAKRPTEKNKNRTLLEKHLRDYTARNSFDYFIHKDLGKFLNRELDFFIKNELLVIDDIDTQADAVQHMTAQFAKIVAIKRIAQKIIAFLAQLEDFQRSLWLKKKFVTETQYCLTLDRVPKTFYVDIVANEKQIQEWIALFKIDKIGVIARDEATQGGLFQKAAFTLPLTVSFLEENPNLVIDTRHFSNDFKMRLLAELPDLDAHTEGVLIQSDNFQALNFLQDRYREQVKCVYIDPPYNTGEDDFTYKDNFQKSSWLTFITDRLLLGRNLQMSDGTITVSIDDAELDNLKKILDMAYSENELAKLVWDRNRKNDAKFFSVGHEYMLVYANDLEYLKNQKIRFREPREGLEDARKLFAKLRKNHGNDWDKIREEWLGFFNNITLADPRRRMLRFNKVGERGPYRDDGNINWPGGGGPKYEIQHPNTKKPVKIPTSGWRYSNPERFWEEYEGGRIIFGSDEKTVPSTISYLFESEGQVMPSVFYSYAQTASQEFEALFSESRQFDNPKNWRDMQRLIRYLAKSNDITLDYFAGSGTTGHAVINLNREDNGKRKYILVEQGEYFDTVLLPRLKKVIYAKDWKNGSPLSTETGVSHCLKYLRLESYEDTLNNLTLARTEAQELALEQSTVFRETYFLNYLFTAESRAALWNITQFENPFDVRLRLLRQNEEREAVIDVVETFNYLLGLVVQKTWAADGFRVVEGTTLKDERILIVWRNCLERSAEDLNRFFERMDFKVRDREYAKIYVNGEHTLPNTLDETNAPKVVQIEEAFRQLMFSK